MSDALKNAKAAYSALDPDDRETEVARALKALISAHKKLKQKVHKNSSSSR